MDDSIRPIHQKAITCYKEKRFNDAIALWEKALEVNPQEIEVLYSLGLIYFEIKKFEDSVNFLTKLLELSPGNFKAMLIVGTAYIKMRKFDLAEEYIHKSIEINPKHKLSLLNLGAIYSVQKKFDDAIEMFRKVVDLHPKEVRAYLGLGKIYSLLGENEQANQHFKNVIELDENGPLGTYAKRAIFLDEGEKKSEKDLEQLYAEGYKFYLGRFYHAAINRFETYLSFRGKDDLVHFMLAESQLRSNLLNESFLSFKKAIINRPKNSIYYKELAVLLDKLGNPSDVLAVLRKAEELGKKDTVTKYLAGKNYNLQGKSEEAISSLKEAIKMDRNNVAARFELGKAFRKSGDLESSQQQLQMVLDHPLDSPLKSGAEALLSAKR